MIGVHLIPLRTVLGFRTGEETLEKNYPGHRIELKTYDLKKFLLLVLKGNGNMLECLYSPIIILDNPLRTHIKEIAKECITRRTVLHYIHMALHQQKATALHPTKKLLCSYRCFLMALHIALSGEIWLNVQDLAEMYGMDEVQDLIYLHQHDERVANELPYISHLQTLHRKVEEKLDQSKLSMKPSEHIEKQLEEILIAARK